MTSITLHFCCWAVLDLFNNLACSWVQMSTVLISKAECIGACVRACVMRLFLGEGSGLFGYWLERKIMKTVKCVFEVPFRKLLQILSLWSQVEETHRDAHIEHIFWGVLVWCCPTPNITLYLGLRSELDCGAGTSMAKEYCGVCWVAAAAQRNISKPQHHSSGGSETTRKVVKEPWTMWWRSNSGVYKQVCGGAEAFSLMWEGSLASYSGLFKCCCGGCQNAAVVPEYLWPS